MTEKSFHISGLSCQHCVAKVKNALSEVDGLRNIEVLQDEQMVKLKADAMPALEELNNILEDYGDYQLSEIRSA